MARSPKRMRLSLNKKLELIERIDAGEQDHTIAERYGITCISVHNIFSERDKITNFIANNAKTTNKKAKVLTNPYTHADLYKLLRQWYVRCVAKDLKVTRSMVRTKAVQLNNELTGGGTAFKGSPRWMQRFTELSCFNKETISEELKTPNHAAAERFRAEFHALMQKEKYRLENVYNADITQLRWKTLPKSTLLSKTLKELESKTGYKQVTIFLCSNVTGSHKLPLLIIGMKTDPPTIDKFLSSVLSITYKTSDEPFMNSDIFNEWFHDCFLKSVTRRQQENGRRQKTLLLLNHAGLDYETRLIYDRDEFTKIMHFFYDAAPLIQPMDRGIIACFKRMYRKTFLKVLMSRPDGILEKNITHAYDNLQMNNCCHMIYDAWENVKNPILQIAWDELLYNKSDWNLQQYKIINRDINETLEKVNSIPGCGGCDISAIMNWFEIDNKHNTDVQTDISKTLLDFINVAMDTETDIPTDVNFEYMLDDSSI